MTKNTFPPIRTWQIPGNALPDSVLEMGRDGILGNEGITLWLGRRTKGLGEITHLVALRGTGVIKRPDFLRIKPWLLNDVTDLTIELGVSLIGQIHSHGPGYGICLSDTDRTYGIAVPHFLSLVAPYYALRNPIGLLDCGVHVFEPTIGYRRLTGVEVKQRLQVVRTARAPLLTVGEV